MIALMTSELMLFAGLVGMYIVIRFSGAVWPPADQPRLPILVTTLNTFVLFGSLVPMTAALRAIGRDDRERTAQALAITAALGGVFLAVQGFEWTRLVHHGLTLASSQYGAVFYVLIGCHAVHVLAAVVWLATVTLLARRGRFTAARHAGLEMCGIYWYFVAALWAFLFPLVYLY
jgi:cytochrome c oxidase subunit 3